MLLLIATLLLSPDDLPAVSHERISYRRVAKATRTVVVRSRPSRSVRPLYTVKAGESLVVKPGEKWDRVLLESLKYGYAEASGIKVLDYEYKAERLEPSPLTLNSTASTVEQATGDLAAEAAYQWIGKKFGPNEFVKQVYSRVGTSLPADPWKQSEVGAPVKELKELLPGDRLYFWDYKNDRVAEGGLYYRQGWFLHPTRSGLRLDFLGEKRWMKRLVAARR